MDDFGALANDLADWLSGRAGVTSVQRPLIPQHSAAPRRGPFHRPAAAAPAFEIRFTFKGRPRRFRYFIEGVDDSATMKATLRVHSNGELLVTVPDGPTSLMPNDIHYDSRFVAAGVFGEVAPNR